MLLSNRGYTTAASYRYGFNGKENDNEVKGITGSQQDYGMRIYDPRLGKFLSVDPITNEYPELTPYQFASNRSIDGVDEDGLEFRPSIRPPRAVSNQQGGRQSLSFPRQVYVRRSTNEMQRDVDIVLRLQRAEVGRYREVIYGPGIVSRVPTVNSLVGVKAASTNNSSGNTIRTSYRNPGGAYSEGYRRTLAREGAWAEETELVRTTGRGTRDWEENEIKELLKTGKVSGYEGHHRNTAKANPELLGEPDNIEFVRGRTEHLEKHEGNFQNQKSGVPLLNRRELIRKAQEQQQQSK